MSDFVDGETGFLHIYSKQSKLWRKQIPEKVMTRNKYYHQDWAPEGIDKNILEKRLGAEAEPKGLHSLRKLVKSPETLDDDDTANILNYLQLQRIRVPRQADTAKSLAKTAVTYEILKTKKGREVLKHAKVVIKDSVRFDFMKAVHGSLSPYFSRMIWEIVEAEEGASFVTSDSPVTFYNVDFIPPAEPEAGLFGTIVFYPIDKKHMLIMRHPEYESGEKEASDTLPKGLDIEDGVIEIRRDIVLDKQGVQKHNWLMLQQSQDLIVGESKSILENTVGNKLTGH